MNPLPCMVITLMVSAGTVGNENTVQKYEQIARMYYQKCPIGRRCDGSRVDHDVDYVLTPDTGPCCATCSCEDDCVEAENCCPDKLALVQKSNEHRSNVNFTCTAPLLKRRRRGDGNMVVQSCPKNFKNESVKQLCTDFSTATHSYLSLNESGPVTDNKWLKTTYDNIYCAFCNGLSENDVLFWLPTYLECEKGYFYPFDEEDLLKHIWTTNCNVIYSPPNGTFVTPCSAFTSQCNTTGKWSKYDSLVEEACHSFTAEYNGIYQNVFCYECNEILEPPYICSGYSNTNAFPVSFSAILNFMGSKNSVNSITSDECQTDYIYDSYQTKCIKIHCHFGGQYYNGTCMQGLVESSGGLRFQANIKLTPQTELKEDVVSMLDEIINKNVFGFTTLPYALSYTPCRETLFFEKRTQNNAEVLNVRYELNAAFSISDYKDIAFVQEVLGLHQTTRNFSNGNQSVLFYLELYANTIADIKTDYIRTTNNKLVYLKDVRAEWCSTESETITTLVLTSALKCPLVRLNKRTFTWEFKGTDVHIHQLDLIIPDSNLLKRHDDSEIFICADIYFEGVRKIINARNRHLVFEPVSPVGYVTLACMILSVICLTVTIFTYVCFPSLRTQPGVNNTILCLVLIIAQSLFQFGVGQKENVSYTFCVFIGILVHFFWLFAILWMNVCCLHMARVFRSLKPNVLHNYNIKTSITYLIYCFLLSSLFVVLNIVFTRITSDGNIVGYAEGNLCYISSPRMIGVMFALPVGLVVLSNCLLFLYTVCQIYTIKKIPKANRKSRNFLVVYVRLSSITGLTWVFGFVYSLSSVVIFEYIFAILNAGQGVFIMVAFVMNRRVLSMYRAKLLKRKTPSTKPKHQNKDNNLDVKDD